MKIRVRIPNDPSSGSVLDNEKRDKFVDDVMMWAMEVDMDVALYGFYNPLTEEMQRGRWGRPSKIWAVFTVEPDNAFLFCLKWGATLHKDKKHRDKN